MSSIYMFKVSKYVTYLQQCLSMYTNLFRP